MTLATLLRSPQEAAAVDRIREVCAGAVYGRAGRFGAAVRMALDLPTRTPSSMGYFRSPGLRRGVEDLLHRERFDLAFVHCSSMAQYVDRAAGLPKILDFCDMDSQKWLAYADFAPFPLSLGYRIEGRKLARAEAELARRFDLSTCATPAEKATLDSFGTGARSDWFPNGVDTEYFRPDGGSYDADQIAFVGKMDYFPNVEAVTTFSRDVLPLLRRERPGIRFLIVGSSPSRAVRRLSSLEGVTVTGRVPDVRPYLLRSALTIAPLAVARGTQNKILESMALGVPVVSSRTAAGGVDAVPGEHLAVADGAGEQAKVILRILGDSSERRRLAEAGRSRTLSHHTWDAATQRLDGLIAACVSGFPWPRESRFRNPASVR